MLIWIKKINLKFFCIWKEVDFNYWNLALSEPVFINEWKGWIKFN